MLPKNQFNNVIRLLRRADIETVNTIRNVTYRKMKELGLKRDVSKAAQSTPNGSDQVDVQSLVVWINAIKPDEKRAQWQLIEIDATAVARS